MSYISSNRLRYHYEYILRQDLLLKFNYVNIMQVPRLCEIYIYSQVAFESIKNVSLALELLSGQKIQERGALDGKKGYEFKPVSTKGTRIVSINRNNKGALKNRLARGAINKMNIRGDTRGSAVSTGGYGSTRLSLVETSLRGPHLMYNFLEKFITVIAFFDYTVQFQVNTILIQVGSPIRLFPEIQNHFGFFENIQNIQVKVVTSALTEKETQLLWAGFIQKEL
jgi:hypothetical protein